MLPHTLLPPLQKSGYNLRSVTVDLVYPIVHAFNPTPFHRCKVRAQPGLLHPFFSVYCYTGNMSTTLSTHILIQSRIDPLRNPARLPVCTTRPNELFRSKTRISQISPINLGGGLSICIYVADAGANKVHPPIRARLGYQCRLDKTYRAEISPSSFPRKPI